MRLLPKSLQHVALQRILQKSFQETIEEGTFDYLEGKWVRIVIDDAGVDWFLSMCDEKVIVANCDLAADVTIQGNSRDFILLASRKQDSDTLFFQRRIITFCNQ